VRWLLLAFVVVPVLELALLVWLGGHLGFWPTVALSVLSGIIGGILAKREGLRVWRDFRSALEQVKPPERGVVDGVLVLIGAALLIAPGVLSDALGLLLLIPITRAWLSRPIKRAVDRRLQNGQARIMNAPWAAHAEGSAAWRAPSSASVVTTVGESVDDPPAGEPPRLEDRKL